MDWQQLFIRSRSFYIDHGLSEWAHAIPNAVPGDLDEDPGLHAALKVGFRAGFLFPPFTLQMQTLGRLIDETARKPATGLPDTQQYSGDVFLADMWTKTANGKVLQRANDLSGRETNPYLFLYAPNPCAKVWGRTGQQIAEFFQAKYWNGLTVPEYFVLQRVHAERWGDHRFFDEALEGTPMHWLWLIDSMTATDCSVAMSGSRQINVQACPVGHREARRAAIAGMVFPLEG